MFSYNWEYNEFDSRKRRFDVYDGFTGTETPTPPVLVSWKNKWQKDETIQITCSGMKYKSTIISNPTYSNLIIKLPEFF